jgi:hypothetical protein
MRMQGKASQRRIIDTGFDRRILNPPSPTGDEVL